jgi:hypothetical protein
VAVDADVDEAGAAEVGAATTIAATRTKEGVGLQRPPQTTGGTIRRAAAMLAIVR